MNETMQSIMNRRSTRKYTDEPVSAEALQQIVDAGLWAPTARNEQEVKIAVMDDPALRKAFRDAYEAASGRKNFDYGCPVFLFLYGDKDFPYTELDSGIVVENMAVAAEGLGLGTVIIGCIRDFMRSDAGAAWREKIGMKENDLFTIGLCIGHIAEPTKPQVRKDGRLLFVK